MYYGKRNVNKVRPEISEIDDATINTIKEYNDLDIKLYEHVKSELFERVNGGGASFKRELKTFQMLNKPYSRIFSILRSVKNRFSAYTK